MGLLQQPDKHHDILDDLEFCFWVRLYVSFIHFELERGVPKLQIFNEYSDDIDEHGSCQTTGGDGKKSFFSSAKMDQYQWKCPALNSLIHKLTNTYQRLTYLQLKALNPAKAGKLKVFENKLRTIDPILELFDEALASDQWVEDRRTTPVDKTTNKQDEQTKLQARTGLFTKTIEGGRQFSMQQLPSSTRAVTMSAHSSHGSAKRSSEDVAEEDADLSLSRVSQPAKKARTERPPPKELSQRPAHEHRYQTRSKTRSNDSNAGKKKSQDVVMKDVDHSHATRSKSKPKPKTAETRRVPQPKPAKKSAKQPPVKRNEKRVRAKKQPEQNKRPTQR